MMRKITRIPAEDPDAVRDRDRAHFDRLPDWKPWSARGDKKEVYGDEGTLDEGRALRRKTRGRRKR